MSELHRQLREATAEAHRRLESGSIFRHYLSADLTPEGFHQISARTCVAHAAWQVQLDQLFPGTGLEPDWHIDLGADLLNKDSAGTAQSLDAGVSPPSLAVTNTATYLGCAYVFEGSKLGASVILKTLRSNPKLADEQFHYFSELISQGRLRAHWQEWIDRLDRQATERQLDAAQITNSAVACFETLHAWFGEHSREQAAGHL